MTDLTHPTTSPPTHGGTYGDTQGSPYGTAPAAGGSTKDKAAETATAAKQAGADVAHTAVDKAKDVADETRRQARDLLGEAKTQLHEQAGGQQKTLVKNLRSLGDELDGMTRTENQGVATDLVCTARDQLTAVTDWLDGREPGDLVGELRTFARKRPGTFLLGAALAGVLAGRLTRGAVAAHQDDSTGQHASPTQSVMPTSTGYSAPPIGEPVGPYGTTVPGTDYGSTYGDPVGAQPTTPNGPGYGYPPAPPTTGTGYTP